jgi:four helix bundle protein
MLKFQNAELLKRSERGSAWRFGHIVAFQHFSVSAFELLLLSSAMRLTEELRDRTKQYASAVICFYVKLPLARDEVWVLGKQLLRSGSSVAAHAREASRSRSDAEFCSKLDGLLQEADESQLWLELLRDDCGIAGTKVDSLIVETSELLAIFTTIVAKPRKRGV